MRRPLRIFILKMMPPCPASRTRTCSWRQQAHAAHDSKRTPSYTGVCAKLLALSRLVVVLPKKAWAVARTRAYMRTQACTRTCTRAAFYLLNALQCTSLPSRYLQRTRERWQQLHHPTQKTTAKATSCLQGLHWLGARDMRRHAPLLHHGQMLRRNTAVAADTVTRHIAAHVKAASRTRCL